MTREEAIQILIESKDETIERTMQEWDEYDKKLYQAIDIAIEALKAEPSIEGRYEKAIKTLQEMPKYLNGIKAKQIKKISIDAIQGEWVCSERAVKYYGDDIVGYSYWHECSQCGSRPPKNIFTKQEWLSNYCPNCGARMKVR